MDSVAITLRGSHRIERLKQHLTESGVCDFRLFYGIDAPYSGITTNLTYEVDNPGSGYIMAQKTTGCYLSHWMLWTALEFDRSVSDAVMIFEDDVILHSGWKKIIDDAILKLPSDWDILFGGSCCASDKLGNQIDHNLFEGVPLCLHFYIVRKKALKTLIETNSKFSGPIDIGIYFNSKQHLKSYIIFPRVADQVDTVLSD